MTLVEEYKEIEIDLSTMGNLTAVLMYKNIPVLRFMYRDGFPKIIEVTNVGRNLVPKEIIDSEDKPTALVEFLLRRICPNITINNEEFKESSTILFPHLQRYLTYTYGQCIFDEYWLDCIEDRECWNNTLFEFVRFPRKRWEELPRYRKRKDIENYVLNMVKID